MNYKQKVELVRMIRWAIKKLLDEHDDMVMNMGDLFNAAEDAWDSLFEDGTLSSFEQS